MPSKIKLIIGLANPGERYAPTRHNAGAWFIEQLAGQTSLPLDTKLKCQVAKVSSNFPSPVLLAIPNSYMNISGLPVRAITQYYKIQPEEILVAHDEIDLPPGIIKIKEEGGHGGHNGLRDIFRHLGTQKFWRLRIGVGRPTLSSEVENYVLKAPNKQEKEIIDSALYKAEHIIPKLLQGDYQGAMNELHTQDQKEKNTLKNTLKNTINKN